MLLLLRFACVAVLPEQASLSTSDRFRITAQSSQAASFAQLTARLSRRKRTYRSYFRAFNRMPFSRYVEIGRVALINYGEEYGKLVVISDVVDQNRVRFWLISGQL